MANGLIQKGSSDVLMKASASMPCCWSSRGTDWPLCETGGWTRWNLTCLIQQGSSDVLMKASASLPCCWSSRGTGWPLCETGCWTRWTLTGLIQQGSSDFIYLSLGFYTALPHKRHSTCYVSTYALLWFHLLDL